MQCLMSLIHHIRPTIIQVSGADHCDSHAVPGSQVSMDILVSCQVFHALGDLGAHDHQSLTDLPHLIHVENYDNWTHSRGKD